MKVSVKPLRQRGARLPDQQIASLPAFDGYLSLYGIGTTLQLSLYDGSGKQDSLIPVRRRRKGVHANSLNSDQDIAQSSES